MSTRYNFYNYSDYNMFTKITSRIQDQGGITTKNLIIWWDFFEKCIELALSQFNNVGWDEERGCYSWSYYPFEAFTKALKKHESDPNTNMTEYVYAIQIHGQKGVKEVIRYFDKKKK